MKILDNITNTVRDDLRVEIKKGSRVSIAAACFSMYAYKELKKQLETIDEFEFIFTSPTFVKEKAEKQKREFYIPRISRETSLYGTEFEIKLRNEMTQRAIAKECADWIRRKATFKSNTTGENMAGFMTVDSGAAQTAYMPIGGFTTVDIGCERGNNSYNMVNCMEAPFAQQYMKLFDSLWNDRDKMQDVTDVVLENISTAYAENSPEFIYFMTLYHDVTQDYRDDVQTGTLAPVPETLKPIEEGVHTLVQAIYDDSMLKSMFEDGNKPKVLENPLNDRFEKAEFQKLWQTINHKYAYTVDFDSEELIRKAIEYIDRELYVSRLQYTVTYAGQKDVLSADMVREGSSFSDAKSRTKKLEHDYAGQVAYDLIGKIAEGTTLTRHTVARILQGIKPTTFAMYQNNPEEFIAKVIRLVKEQKATMIVEHITYDTIEGSYDSSIFTAEKHALTMDKAYKAQKAIQDYVFTDGTAEKSVERKFAENLDGAEEVFIYAKLPKGFYIPTPVGHYSPDWAIVFHEGKVKHIYFVAETKGTMESLNLRPIEKSKIDCAKKLFAKLSDGLVTYDHVDSYQELMNKVLQ